MDNICREIGSLPFPVSLAYALTFESARTYAREGYEGIECAFGTHGSVVGGYVLDHHGTYSHEKPVSIKAASLALSGVRLNKFLVTGLPDSDAIYAILVLSQNIKPTPAMATSIAELDIDPIGINRLKGYYARDAYFEMLLEHPERSFEGYEKALQIGMKAFSPAPLSKQVYLNLSSYEERRLAHAKGEIRDISGDFGFVISDGILDTIHFRQAPIILQYKPLAKKITVRGCTARAAERLGTKTVFQVFGKEGLRKVYGLMDQLLGEGSGGREDIGGSAQHLCISLEQALSVFQSLSSLVA